MADILECIDLSSADVRSAPIPERAVGLMEWVAAAEALGRDTVELMGLWASRRGVHMALRRPGTGRLGLLTYPTDSSFPSVGRHHAAAQRPERAIRDIYGFVAEGAPDLRPWLDHGRLGVHHPPGTATPVMEMPAYDFLPAEGESLHQVPVGPIHAGIIEPGHFRFTAQGETVVRLEERLGYAHKGIGSLLRGAPIARGTMLAGRTSGDSTVAYAWAFSQAVEAAHGMTVPDRALWLRGLMAELERLANHLGDIGAICNDAAFAMMHAHCGVLRERVLRAADAVFGHRLMQDMIRPGGVARDLRADGAALVSDLLGDIRARFGALVRLYDNSPSLLDRTVGTGRLSPDLAARFAAGGFVGRASGRAFDARRGLPYGPYDRLAFDVPCRSDGDVNARIWIRIEEVRQSLALVEQILDSLPAGPVFADLPEGGSGAMGLGLVEGFRGDILAWIEIGPEGTIAEGYLRDPSWFQWPLLEAAIEGNIIADFPLCNKSFNCSYSGHDL
ncbi:NADH-quinone oxidoreductase subunit C [Solirhodobacter olei]|uniref:hydrogenase large subunit n=1 Tax=Solirhodobacter olei TaxID=2493082 RepID=UPI000FD9F6B8|nr:NADH-quinone oxidoreductase subunit C [Solirhodobacter olei]